MIDLHTHTIFSDGELIPSELVRRAVAKGYKAIAITDHVDHSNIDIVIPRIVREVGILRDHMDITVIAGAEITHVPPALIADLVKEARRMGAQIVLVHGETIVEPVKEGTNRAAIEAGVDILAHPGLISDEELQMAKERGIVLEITARKGHSLSNGHVARGAARFDIPLVINTDSHSPSDLITRDFARRVLLSAGIEESRVQGIFDNSANIVKKAIGGQL